MVRSEPQVSLSVSVRPLFAAMAILSIFVVSGLFMGAPPVNAQEEKPSSIEEELGYIKGTLEQMNERLSGLNHLSERIDGIGERIDETKDSITVRIDKLTNLLIIGIVAMVAAIVAQPVVSAYANKKIK